VGEEIEGGGAVGEAGGFDVGYFFLGGRLGRVMLGRQTEFTVGEGRLAVVRKEGREGYGTVCLFIVALAGCEEGGLVGVCVNCCS
jgi:hypothetical protein